MDDCVPENVHTPFLSRMWVHAAKWVHCSPRIPRDQFSVIAHLEADYQQEAVTVELYLMELHLRKSFGRERRGGSAAKEMRWHV